MNPRLLFLIEFTKLLGRLGQAASNGDTHGFLGIITLVRKLCDTTEQNLTFKVLDDEVSDDDL